MSQETGLSTQFAQDYSIKKEPAGVKLQVGKRYDLDKGSYDGIVRVEITAMRKINDCVFVYYKYEKKDDKWVTTWINQNSPLDTFKAQLVDYGKIEELDLLYPGSVSKE